MSQKAIYPGTFDPITKGHIDLVERACKLFDKVVLAIAASEAKSPLFTLEERIDISKRIFKGNDQVEIIGFSGLLVDLAKDNDATILIRGLRVVADFESTSQPSVAAITVDGNNHVNFFDNRTELHDLRIRDSRIETTVSSADLVLSAPGTGSVVIDDQLQILTTPSPDDGSVDPAQPTDGLKVYAKTQGVGKTGLYYVNSNNVRDELISKNRSLLLSMIY